jgi:E3 ubiquitin-protein ligase RNF139
MGFVYVILRVPPLFIIDELLRIGLGLPQGDNNYSNSSFEVADEGSSIIDEELTSTIADYRDVVQYDDQFYKVFLVTVIKFTISCLGKLQSQCNIEISSRVLSVASLLCEHDFLIKLI